MAVQGRAGVSGVSVEIGEFAVQLQRQLQGVPQTLGCVIGQAEDEVAQNVNAGRLDLPHDGNDTTTL